MATVGFSAASPLMFTGVNYPFWVVKMKSYLKAFDLWDVVELESIFGKIMLLEDPKQVWDSIREEYQGNDRTKVMQIMNLFQQFELKMLGQEVTDQRMVNKILMKNNYYPVNLKDAMNMALYSEKDEAELWHRRLGHVNYGFLSLMASDQLVNGLPGIVKPERYCWVYFLKQKFDAVKTFTKFKALVENFSSLTIKTLRSENGTEFTATEFEKFLIEHDVQHHLIVTYNPQQMVFETVTDTRKDSFLADDEVDSDDIEDERLAVEALGWIFRTKLNLDGLVNKYRERLVVKGYAQVYGKDYMETFASVARHDTIRMLTALSAKEGWSIYHVDVKSAFLNGYLLEDIFIEQPKGYVEEGFEGKVCKLIKTLYGLKPDIMFATSLLSRFMWNPSTLHLKAAKRIFRYIKGTVGYGLKFLKEESGDLKGFSDSDWAGSLDDSKTTTAIANHALWLRKVLQDLGFKQENGTVLFVDNMSAITIAKNPVQHGRTKHIRFKYHALRDAVKENEINLQYCLIGEQDADIFTKSLNRERFEYLRSCLGVC
ncbi:Uncharacterized protein TCM_032234 [Theobroma cacao]|uniref:Cysteine-rich RLK (RECEPTOR-like protein kinase) 8 n=1 Tax=Theobroma cacao TaxID=3641 RepID=A0A061F9P3_THECC|nr:Uncharacterized protein TCM_032234 [Theobroma cacao]